MAKQQDERSKHLVEGPPCYRGGARCRAELASLATGDDVPRDVVGFAKFCPSIMARNM